MRGTVTRPGTGCFAGQARRQSGMQHVSARRRGTTIILCSLALLLAAGAIAPRPSPSPAFDGLGYVSPLVYKFRLYLIIWSTRHFAFQHAIVLSFPCYNNALLHALAIHQNYRPNRCSVESKCDGYAGSMLLAIQNLTLVVRLAEASFLPPHRPNRALKPANASGLCLPPIIPEKSTLSWLTCRVPPTAP